MIQRTPYKMREPTGKHPALRPVTAEEYGVDPVRGPVPDPLWFRLLERFGFPTLVAAALAWGLVAYNKQVREDAAAQRTNWGEQIDKLVRSQHDDREAMIRALERQTELLGRIDAELKRGNRR